MDKAAAVRAELRGPALDLRHEIPNVMRAYAQLSVAALEPGDLSAETKQLAALAIAITRECDGCIVAHIRHLVRLGVTRRQVAELIGVAISMNGGPGTVWGPRALSAFDQELEEFRSSVGSPKT